MLCPWIHLCKFLQYNAKNVIDNLSGCFFTKKTFEKKKKQPLLQVDSNPNYNSHATPFEKFPN